MATADLHAVLEQAQKLSPDAQLELSKRLARKLAQATPAEESRDLAYGEFAHTPGPTISSEEAFKLAG